MSRRISLVKVSQNSKQITGILNELFPHPKDDSWYYDEKKATARSQPILQETCNGYAALCAGQQIVKVEVKECQGKKTKDKSVLKLQGVTPSNIQALQAHVIEQRQLMQQQLAQKHQLIQQQAQQVDAKKAAGVAQEDVPSPAEVEALSLSSGVAVLSASPVSQETNSSALGGSSSEETLGGDKPASTIVEEEVTPSSVSSASQERDPSAIGVSLSDESLEGGAPDPLTSAASESSVLAASMSAAGSSSLVSSQGTVVDEENDEEEEDEELGSDPESDPDEGWAAIDAEGNETRKPVDEVKGHKAKWKDKVDLSALQGVLAAQSQTQSSSASSLSSSSSALSSNLQHSGSHLLKAQRPAGDSSVDASLNVGHESTAGSNGLG